MKGSMRTSGTVKAELLLEAGTSLEKMGKYDEANNLYNSMLIMFEDMNIKSLVERRINGLKKYIGG